MAYYDRIARKWHAVTGARGGAVNELLLNDRVLARLPPIAGRAILELGAGNGYFMPLVLRHFSGQVPARVVITDQSAALLDLARRSFRVADAEYAVLDVCRRFPFEDATFHLVLAGMVFNEISTPRLRRALGECYRVLTPGGRLVATVTHPALIESLWRRGQLKPGPGGALTMPGADGLRLPVVRRRTEADANALRACGFECETEEVAATPEVLNAKPGLRQAGGVPVALLFDCAKPASQ
jgi:SAM-dependent methyltransferase